MSHRQPYHGQSRKLVISFDIGTTYSGVSYCLLDPGEVPVIQGVNRFPAQDNGGDSKVPSILYYDNKGKVRAVGAEALQESVLERAEDEGWHKAEWWKPHLRPKHMSTGLTDADIPPLPLGKAAAEILGDFLRYLFECTMTYIEQTHAQSPELLASLKDSIDFVLSHPNGWEGPQQAQIRKAAVLAGLVGNKPQDQSRIQLVTEGEASLHFCMNSNLATSAFHDNQGVIVVDAGGGTIDLSAYYMTSNLALFEEIAPTDCLLQGSIFVTRRAESYLRIKLQGSKFGDESDVKEMTKVFDSTTKLRFSTSSEAAYIKFGTIRDRDQDFGIRSGQLKLPGTDVAKLFEPSINAVIDAVNQQRQAARKPINSVFLVGGFAASDWLFHSLKESLPKHGLNFSRPDSHTSKAVADGAVAFYLKHGVSTRTARVTYGTRSAIEYNKTDPEHIKRAGTIIPRPSGRSVLPNAFSPILFKGMQVSGINREFRKEFITDSASRMTFDKVSIDIICYEGDDPAPRWIDSEPEKYWNLCTITADTSQVAKTISSRMDVNGRQFYRQEFNLVLTFGITELSAQLSWMEDGVEQRNPASVIYDHVIEERPSQ
ncbi:hypothetical protein CONPUDRAFT_125520 [Coniophora puteana RWD-64-598 SS2]|uniref:Actin-like ATPase domain-containing protein n=1 Tax=Coniophora puteana (strain RWD-64-598) TaxID=741705 RepID=A0A5M3MNU5_CONPW|nr:uncharacterized protein CONPUDRAFT_125520 [Coniophora puteana RWD-64-598 SS2]EIW80696.1 hypothetical protein CONPUDRAFT_125520 [Coniophora puteana RWD-64-598 SS2]